MPDGKIVEKLQLELKDTIDGLGCTEVVTASSRNGDVRVLFRVHDEAKWLTILAEFLSNEGDWYSFVGKKYMMYEGNMVFGWVMILESANLDKTVTEVRKILLSLANVGPTGNIANDVSVVVDDGTNMPGEIVVNLPSSSGYEERHQNRVKNLR